jgi:hypothetical protein
LSPAGTTGFPVFGTVPEKNHKRFSAATGDGDLICGKLRLALVLPGSQGDMASAMARRRPGLFGEGVLGLKRFGGKSYPQQTIG